jgi:hypothetical protein
MGLSCLKTWGFIITLYVFCSIDKRTPLMKHRIALIKSLMKADDKPSNKETYANGYKFAKPTGPTTEGKPFAPVQQIQLTPPPEKPATAGTPEEKFMRVKSSKTGDQIKANAAVRQAQEAGMAPTGAKQSAVVPVQEGKKITNPVALRQKMNQALTNVTQQSNPERGSFHQIGSYVLGAMKHLTHPKAGQSLNSTPEQYQMEASNWQGHPVLDMFDDVASKLYEGKQSNNPLKFKYDDAVLQPVLEDLANKKYPAYKNQIMGNYAFGKDSYAASEAGKGMLESLTLANEAKQAGDQAKFAEHMADAKKQATTATNKRDSSGKALPPQTYSMAKRLQSDVYDPNQLPAATQEIEQHFSGDPGLLTHYTNKALAHHHLNQIDDEIDHIVQPINQQIAGIDWKTANPSPEAAKKISQQINSALDFINSKRVGKGGMLPLKAKANMMKLKQVLRHIQNKAEENVQPQKLQASMGSSLAGSNGEYMGQSQGVEPLQLSERVKKYREKLKGGLADGMPDSKFPKQAIKQGMKVEREHTKDTQAQKEITKDHLSEDKKYYNKLETIEKDIKTPAPFRNPITDLTDHVRETQDPIELHGLAFHKDPHVRMHVAHNVATHPTTLKQMAGKESDPKVLKIIKERAKDPETRKIVLAKLGQNTPSFPA